MINKVLILNGPNLNMLGKREPEIYGHETLADIEKLCLKESKNLNIEIDFKQSNFEGNLIEIIQKSLGIYDAIIINPAAYTHTSIAILDALKSVNLPTIEVHLSNIFKREDFRKHSFVSLYANGVISGLGSYGYILAIRAIKNILDSKI